jgi:hypothetical protein
MAIKVATNATSISFHCFQAIGALPDLTRATDRRKADHLHADENN